MDPAQHEEARRHIEQIRKDKFGIELDGTKRPNSLERDLRAALRNLAEELNAKETHFILELLQNAEDNTYPDGAEPELRISVEETDPTAAGGDGCLAFLNNEVGFTPEQVWSLCSVGQSTKEKAHGYIGEKGIGFKSVFRITDQPHVFSRGFQFRFQKPQGPDDLGYIVPHWVDSVPPIVAPAFTAILLPLISGKRASIAQKLAAIPPETILFLTKLRRLVTGPNHSIERDKTSGIVTLTSDGDESCYYVHRERWDKPVPLYEEKRDKVTDRELTVALPLKTPRPCTGRVFAFLPTEFDSGLPFLINADFLLSASRDSLLEDRQWNEWLRDTIGPTVAKAFLAILQQPAQRQDAYRFLPIKEDLAAGADFFAPVVEAVQTELRSHNCVLSPEDNLISPSPSYFAGPLTRRLLAANPPKLTDFPLVHTALESYRKRLEPIGVSTLTISQTLDICNDLTWLAARDADWWETLLDLLSANNTQQAALSNFPLLRCADAACRPPTGEPVFFHAEGQPVPPTLPADWPTAHLYDRDLQTRLQKKPAAWEWLKGVATLQPFSIQTYITNRLVPWLAEQTGDKAPAYLLSATTFIADNLKHLDEQARRTVSEKMPWLLADGSILSPAKRATRELVTPECLESDTGWNWVFISDQDRQHFSVLSDSYVQGLPDPQREAALALLKECRAIDWPDPAKLSHPTGQEDWASPRWLRDLNLDSPPQNLTSKAGALDRWMRKFKPENFSKFLSLSQPEWRSRLMREPTTSPPSELGLALRTRPWLTSTKGLTAPEAAFVDDPEIREFLQDSVPYVKSALAVELLEKLGVHVRLSASSLLDLLRQMRESGKVDEALVVRIYRRLHDLAFDATVFRREPLVFLTRPTSRWMTTENVFWHDAGPVFDEEFGYAELTYRNDELHGFFTSKLGVLEDPQEQEFAKVWATLSAAPPTEPEKIQRRLAMILPQLARLADDGQMPEWWSPLQPSLRVWTNTHQFVAATTAFTPDHPLAEELFGSTEPIAWLPKSHQAPRLTKFLRTLGCQSLAAALNSIPLDTVHHTLPAKPRFLTRASKELLVSWVCATGDWNSQRQDLADLLRTQEADVPALSVEYRLATGNSPAVRPADAFWAPEDSLLYLRQGATPKAQQSAVAATLASRIAQAGKTAEDTIYRLLGLEPADAKRELALRKWVLSPEQKEWLRTLSTDWVVLQTTPEDKTQSREARPTARTTETKDTQTPTQTTATGSTGTQTPTAEQSAPPGTGTETTKPAPSSAEGRTPTTGRPEGGTQQGATTTTGGATGSSPDGEEEEDEEAESLKPTDAETDFVHVAAYTRSRPGRQRRRKAATEGSPKEDHPMASVAHATKAQLEDAAVSIVMRLFQQRPELSGFKVLDLRTRNLGFDLHAQKPGRSIRIEIKAHLRQTQSVFVTANEWRQSRQRSQGPPEDHWELWNVENLAADAGKLRVTRYSYLPDQARTRESGFWVDLSACSSEAIT